MKDFKLLIIGGDINAYYLARCYHEYTGKKANLISIIQDGVKPFAYTRYTKILNITYIKNLWDEEVFLNTLDDFYNKNKDKPILLISANETYGKYIAKNKQKLKNKFYFNYPSVSIQQSLVMKDLFYKKYSNASITLPKTIYYDCRTDDKIVNELSYPIIVKPANVIKFKHIEFPGMKKIYRLNSEEELLDTINIVKNGGYDDILIIQEYIPGDDSHLFDAVVYCDKNSKCRLVSFAQIGLQEHNARMIGNATVLINGYSEFKGVDKQIKNISKFMEKIKYKGFAEVDMKYDSRDKTFKVLEINARQGRCSYYITPCGYNLIEILANDLIYNKKIAFKYVNKKQLLTFVPKSIALRYITNEKYKREVKKLWNNRVNPLIYKKDNGILRHLLMLKISYNYYKAYKKARWNWR